MSRAGITWIFQRHVYYDLIAHSTSQVIGAQCHHLDNIAAVGQQVVDDGPLSQKSKNQNNDEVLRAKALLSVIRKTVYHILVSVCQELLFRLIFAL